MARARVVALVLGISVLVTVAAAGAQELPPLEPGVEVYVPIVESIVVDGDLSDWSGMDSITTSNGPQPPADPANTGSMTWQVAANDQSLLFSATVVDATIVAGQHGDDYWNEDSIELYVNFSGDLSAVSYGPGVAQITISPIDIGNTDPNALTITGNNVANLTVQGFVFATDDGWGLEIGVPLSGLATPVDGESFGFQVQANGSSGGDRDTKLIWSLADVSDQSFANPSVFGTGRFVRVVGDLADAPAEAPLDTTNDTVDTPDIVLAAPDEPAVVDAASAAPVEPVLEESSGNRALLVAAVVSAAVVLGGGFWFEHRRKLSEAAVAATLDVEESEPRELESGVS